MVVCGIGYWYRAFWGGSICVVSFDNIVIILTNFVVCRVLSSTQGAFCWRVPSLDRLCGLMVRVSGYRYRGPGFDPWRY